MYIVVAESRWQSQEKRMEHLRNNSSGSLAIESVRESRVLVLYTGGTIGMIRNEDGGNTFLFLFHVKL